MSEGSTASNVLGRGALAGVAGTVVMTAFQKFVEMPITGRSDSYAGRFRREGLPARSRDPGGTTAPEQRDPPGARHDVGRGVRARGASGGPQAVAAVAVFVTVCRGDVLLNRTRAVPATGLVGRGLGCRHDRQACPSGLHGCGLRALPRAGPPVLIGFASTDPELRRAQVLCSPWQARCSQTYAYNAGKVERLLLKSRDTPIHRS